MHQNNQLSHSIQCIPTYCNLEPDSRRVKTGLRNISAKSITIPVRAVVCLVQLDTMVPKVHAPEGLMSSHLKDGEDKSCVLVQLDLGGLQQCTDEQQQAARDLLCVSSDIFSRNDLDPGKCDILKDGIKTLITSPLKKNTDGCYPIILRRGSNAFRRC